MAEADVGFHHCFAAFSSNPPHFSFQNWDFVFSFFVID